MVLQNPEFDFAPDENVNKQFSEHIVNIAVLGFDRDQFREEYAYLFLPCLLYTSKGIPVIMVVAVDVALVNLAFYLSFTLRFLGNIPEFNMEPFLKMAPWLSLSAVILLHALDLYSKQLNGFMPILRAVVTAAAGLTLCGMVITFWLRGFAFPRTVFIIALLFQLALLLTWRVLHWRLEMWIHGQKKLLVIGHYEEVKQALDKLLGLPRGMFEIAHVLEPKKWREIPRWISRVDAVMIAGTLDMELKNRIIRYSFDCMKEVFIVPDLYEIILARATFTLSLIHI